MIRQTAAIFLDAYRELNAKKLFWVVLILSAVMVLSFAVVGINEKGVTVLWWQFEMFLNTSLVSKEKFYKGMFTTLGIGIWLTWAATILALVSTAGIFPDFISGGSIDLFLSKPVSRLRLFLTKYAAGLLFVTLQVLVFTAASFAVIGFRAGTWAPGLFLAVPIVVCFFSYLFAVSVLIGIVTRSTIAALLLTILFWLLVVGVHMTEVMILRQTVKNQQEIARLDRSIDSLQRELKTIDPAAAPRRQFVEKRLEAALGQRSETSDSFKTPHRVFLAVMTVLPKTSETVEVLNRSVMKAADLQPLVEQADDDGTRDAFGRSTADAAADVAVAEIIHHRSLLWVLGTSLAFEAVVLFLAAWVFCRRDY